MAETSVLLFLDNNRWIQRLTELLTEVNTPDKQPYITLFSRSVGVGDTHRNSSVDQTAYFGFGPPPPLAPVLRCNHSRPLQDPRERRRRRESASDAATLTAALGERAGLAQKCFVLWF